MAEKEYNPFLSLDAVVRAGYKDFIELDGEERGIESDFVPTEEIHVSSKLHPDFHGQFDILDPLQILLLKEEGKLDNDELGAVRIKKDLLLHNVKTFIAKDTGTIHVIPASDDFDVAHFSSLLEPFEFEEIPEGINLPKFIPIPRERIKNFNWFTRGYSHGKRGRKPTLRKHKRLAAHKRHKLSKEVREAVMTS